MFVTKPKGTPGHHLGSSARHGYKWTDKRKLMLYFHGAIPVCWLGLWTMVLFSSLSQRGSCSWPGSGVLTSVTLHVYLQRRRGSNVLQYSREHLEGITGQNGRFEASNAFIRRQACLSVDRNGSCGEIKVPCARGHRPLTY